MEMEMTQDLFELQMALIDEGICPECQYDLEAFESNLLEPDGVDNREEREERTYFCHGCKTGFFLVLCHSDMTASFRLQSCTYEEMLQACGLDYDHKIDALNSSTSPSA